MVLFIINITFISLLFIGYRIVKKRLERSILFEVSILYKYIYFFSPLIICLVNLIGTTVLYRRGILFSLLPLLVPICRVSYRIIMNYFGEKEYLNLENKILPIIFREFNKKDITINRSQISLRILDNDEANSKKTLKIVIDIAESTPPITDIKTAISREVKLLFQLQYKTDVRLRDQMKKKNSTKYSVLT
ncbi:hypothetical protein BGM25_24035 [Bacillus sp. FJAT-29953]|nr:hypothetical protein [Bacillus sp. FJAT-29953]